jgi:cytochrome b561
MPTVSRYHPAMVILHWLIALLVLGALFMGFVVFDAIPDEDPAKKIAIGLHLAGGLTILILLSVRLVLRMRTDRPPPAPTGAALLDRLAPLTHWAFYLAIFLMIGTGVTTSLAAGLPGIIFMNNGKPLPKDFDVFVACVIHGKVAWVLVGLIALHVSAALYHQFIRRDHLLRRMAFGPRA